MSLNDEAARFLGCDPSDDSILHSIALLINENRRLLDEISLWREMRTMGGPPLPYTHDWRNAALPPVKPAIPEGEKL